MKRALALLLSLLMLLSLTACKKGDADRTPFGNAVLTPDDHSDEKGTTGTDQVMQTAPPVMTVEPMTLPTVQTEEPVINAEDLIYESYSDAGEYVISYDDGAADTFYYSFHLPHISDSTQGAREINRSIDEHFGALIEQEYSIMAEEWFPNYGIVNWYASFYQELLVIVITAESLMEFSDYGVYCYNVTTGEWLQGSALLEYLYIDEQEFLEATREAAQECFISYYGDLPEEDRELYGYDECLAWTISDENINLDNLLFYPDEHGELVVIAPIGSMAGAQWYYHYIFPEIAYG